MNLVPLAKRLEQVDALKIKSPEKGVEIAKSLFQSAVSSTAVGKKIVHFSQKANVRGSEITLKVDPNIAETKISPDLKKRITNNTIVLLQNGARLTISPTGGFLENEKNLVILGQNDLIDCLISPNILVNDSEKNEQKYSKQIRNIDSKMYTLSRKINFSSILRPQNYSAELHKFLKNPHEYNPTFEYKFPSDEKITEIDMLIEDLRQEIELLSKSAKNFSKIFSEKLSEISDRKNLILAYKNADYENIFKYNVALFGDLKDELLSLASKKTFEKAKKNSENVKILGEFLSLDEIQAGIDEYLKTHNIE